MKKLFVISLLAIAIIFGFLFNFKKSLALGLTMPFGGRVITSTGQGAFCVGLGPITIMPVSTYPIGPYFVPIANPYLYSNPVINGTWILGNYGPMVPGCVSEFGVPFPAFPIMIYGTSKVPSI